MKRRRFFLSLAALSFAGTSRASAGDTALRGAHLRSRLRELEQQGGGRLGVHVLDTATGAEYGYRQDERFMLLSSFKLLASALVLQRVDGGQEVLDRRIVYDRSVLLPWSPVTERHADGQGMTLAALCEAAITTSDNAAANLILASYGGPAALTAWLRQLGDGVTRLDRNEPELNTKHPQGELDTTSPRAMTQTMQKLLVGDVLSPASRATLQRWLLANTTGGRRLKAGLPADWRIGDKTGTNRSDANDVGIVWPPGGKPLLVSAYLADSTAAPAARDACLAGVGRLLVDIAGNS